MLAMAEPDGVVRASPSGLARRANITSEACRTALKVLEGPDLESRSQAWGGRRLDRVEGGWLILNYRRYRSIVTRDELAAPPSEPGYVYYALATGGMKIGYSRNPWARVKDLSVGHPGIKIAATERGEMSLEQERHQEFADLRISGEWFRFEGQLAAHVRALAQKKVKPRINDGSATKAEAEAKAPAEGDAPSQATAEAAPEAPTSLQTAAPAATPPSDYTLQCVLAANRALDARTAGGFKPLVASVERDAGWAAGWETDGIPVETAAAVISSRIAAARQENLPRSLAYFDHPVREAAALSEAGAGETRRVVNLVCAYHGRETGLEDQLLTPQRETMIAARYRESHDVSELLFGVDGLRADTWAVQHGKVQLEDLFRTRGELERHARAAGYKPGRVHPSAGADVAGAA